MTRQTILLLNAVLLVVAMRTGAAQADPAIHSPAQPQYRVSQHRASHHGRHTPHMAARTSRPPQPASSTAPAPTSGPAPVPNEALNAPIEDPHPETSVAPSVFQLHYPPQGEGYTTGSSAQAMDDREAARATGVEMKVPLPQ